MPELFEDPPFILSTQALLLYAAWWTFWTFVQTVVLHRLGLDWKTALIDSATSNILLGLLSLTAILVYSFYQPGKTNRIYRFIYALAIAFVFCFLLQWILGGLLQHNTSYLPFLEKSMPIRFICSLLIISFITLANWMWNYIQEQNEREDRRQEAEQLVKEAELLKLRQQLQPHFLFNSLNSISALVGSKPEEARSMIQQLSDFLRGTLRKDEQQTVPLKEEIQQLSLYLNIERLRFSHRLNVETELPDAAGELMIPPLLLQPVVENAIKFGLYGTLENITVSLAARQEGQFLVIEVKNPYDEQDGKTKEGTGFGLSSISRRLLLLYSRNDLLTTEKANGIFTTKIKIPQLK